VEGKIKEGGEAEATSPLDATIRTDDGGRMLAKPRMQIYPGRGAGSWEWGTAHEKSESSSSLGQLGEEEEKGAT